MRLPVLALFAALIATTAFAQDYPSKPVTLVVPFPAGGPSDALARGVAQRMAKSLGQPLVVENIGGAGGAIGLARVAKAAPDGYTLGFGTIGTHVANVALYRSLPYDPQKDFEPVALLGTAPLILIAKPSLPAGDLKGFIAYVKQNPGKLSYGSAGVGSISHMGCIMLLSALGLDIQHVPYRGVAPAMTDLIGGQIDFMCDQTTTAMPQIKAGRVKALAALTARHIDVLPNLRTANEQGARRGRAFLERAVRPKGDSAVIDRVNRAVVAAMQDEELRRSMEQVGVDLPQRERLNRRCCAIWSQATSRAWYRC